MPQLGVRKPGYMHMAFNSRSRTQGRCDGSIRRNMCGIGTGNVVHFRGGDGNSDVVTGAIFSKKLLWCAIGSTGKNRLTGG